MFARLLRALGTKGLILQSPDGTLLRAPLGEKIVNHYSFFTVIVNPEEYRVVAGDTTIRHTAGGQATTKSFIIFGGQRWRIVSIDEKRKIIEVTRAAGGRVPSFTGLGRVKIHDNVRKEMFAVYEETATPKFLDPKAAQLLSEGRDNFHRYRLDQRALVESGSDTLFFLWLGDRITDTIAVELGLAGFP